LFRFHCSFFTMQKTAIPPQGFLFAIADHFVKGIVRINDGLVFHLRINDQKRCMEFNTETAQPLHDYLFISLQFMRVHTTRPSCGPMYFNKAKKSAPNYAEKIKLPSSLPGSSIQLFI